MFKRIIFLSHPAHLFFSILTYLLGIGISHYLGKPIQISTFGLGLFSILAMFASASLFAEYFRLSLTQLAQGEDPRQRGYFRIVLLQVSFALFTISFVAILILLLTRSLNLSAGILFLLVIILFMVFAIPPLRLSETGYGELLLAAAMGTLFPALAFFLQYGRFHRLLSFAAFPLTLLVLDYFLICDFPGYATDLKLGRHSLLTRLGWQRAIPIHHILILFAFMFFGAAPLLGFPWGLVRPVFLALPFAIIQIVWLQRIANGDRPHWNFQIILAQATLGLIVYLLTLTFWIR